MYVNIRNVPRKKLSTAVISLLTSSCIVYILSLSSLQSRFSTRRFAISKESPATSSKSDDLIILIVPPIDIGAVPYQFSSTYDLNSLRRLISSLCTAKYPSKVDLRVILGSEPNQELFLRRYEHVTVASKTWNHGNMEIINCTEYGMLNLILSTGISGERRSVRTIVMDAGIARSVNNAWFEELSLARKRYSHISDIAGISPFRSDYSMALTNKKRFSTSGDTTSDSYLYANNFHCFCIAPTDIKMWRTFLSWLDSRRFEWFLWPHSATSTSSKDGNVFYSGRRVHWTMWYTRFLVEHRLYVLFPYYKYGFHGKNTLTGQTSLMRVEHDGRIVQQEEKTTPTNELEELESVARHGNRTVAMTIVTKSVLNLALSWACNVQVGGFMPKSMVWVAADEESYNVLSKINDTHAVHMNSFEAGRLRYGSALHYNQPLYWLLMLERTRLVRDLVEREMVVLLFDIDQVWLRDPLPALRHMAHTGDVDMIGTIQTGGEIAGNFLYILPTYASKRLWREVTRRFESDLHGANMKKDKLIGVDNDQTLLTKLVFKDKSFISKVGVVFRALSSNRFVDGRWYTNGARKYYGSSAQSPTVLNNNWIIGVKNKEHRAKKFGHWFLNGNQCNALAVQNAIAENEARGKKIVVFKDIIDQKQTSVSPKQLFKAFKQIED